jgi:predicted ArsR family transcriptional regulator
MFAHRQRTLAERYAGRTTGRELPALAGELAAIQDENGYMAEWQPDGEERFLVREHNCAIAKVAGAHPSACAHELALFRELAGPGVEVERVAHMQAGDLECAYVLRRARPPGDQGNGGPSSNGTDHRR